MLSKLNTNQFLLKIYIFCFISYVVVANNVNYLWSAWSHCSPINCQSEVFGFNSVKIYNTLDLRQTGISYCVKTIDNEIFVLKLDKTKKEYIKPTKIRFRRCSNISFDNIFDVGCLCKLIILFIIYK